jgi:hypothetical protein
VSVGRFFCLLRQSHLQARVRFQVSGFGLGEWDTDLTDATDLNRFLCF